MKRLGQTLLLGLILSACHFDEPGGECEYVKVEEVAIVLSVGEQWVVAKGQALTYEIKLNQFDAKPQVGEKFQIESEKIVKGSCTPQIISAVTSIDQEQ